MFGCHHTLDNAGLGSSVTGQVTLQRQLRHTQNTAPGVSHGGVQPYKLLLGSDPVTDRVMEAKELSGNPLSPPLSFNYTTTHPGAERHSREKQRSCL